MKKVIILIISLFLPALVLAEKPIILSGVYEYLARDNTGSVVASGKLIIISPDKGRWEIKSLIPEGNIGPQNGSGELSIEYVNGKIFIDLNPRWDDNNVVLIGGLEKGMFQGDWEWETIAGVASSGEFTAVPK